MSTVDIRGVTVGYGAEPVLRDVDLTVPTGTTTAVLGASGGGKTTAMNCLLGFLTPQAGSIRIGDVDLCQASAATLQAWREQIAYVPQTPGLIHGTVADNVRLGHAELTDAQARELLDRCGGQSLALAKQVSDDAEGLSAGERRRVALAASLGLWVLTGLIAAQAFLRLDSIAVLYGLIALQSLLHPINQAARGAIIARNDAIITDIRICIT